MNAKSLGMAAICAAIGVVLLYLGAIVKTGTVAIYFVCSLVIMMLVDRGGKKYAFMSYVVTAGLSWLLVADKTIAAAYTLIFGLYPIIKAFGENGKNIAVEWLLKIIFFNLAFSGCLGILKFVIGNLILKIPIVWLIVGANLFFVLYDILLSFGYTKLKIVLNRGRTE